jgi:hypothetical protein
VILTRSRLLIALTAAALEGAAPAIPFGPVPKNVQTATLAHYLTALTKGDYTGAYALLVPELQAYYRNAANFASTFAADGFRVQQYSLVGSRGDATSRAYTVAQKIAWIDHANEHTALARLREPFIVATVGSSYRVLYPGDHPWRAYRADATTNLDGAHVTVRKVSFFPRRIEVVVNFMNLGTAFVTFLPYGRSVLKDEGGRVFPVLQTKNWILTDRQLFLGLRLAPRAQYTGAISFESPQLDEGVHTFALTIAPVLRDGADAPVEIVLPPLRQPA